MSKFIDGYSQKVNPAEVNLDWEGPLAVSYPNVAQALSGTPGWRPGTPGHPPMTIMLFARDGKLKFSCGNKDHGRTFFGHVAEPGTPMEAIEKALNDGEGEWVEKRGK